MRKTSELFFSLILIPIDFAATLVAFILAYYIRVKLEGRPVPNPLGLLLFVKIFLVILPVWIIIFAVSGLYNLSSIRGRMEELGKIFVAVSGGAMFAILIDFMSRTPIFPAKAIPIYGYGLTLVSVATGRQLVRGVQRILFRFGIGVHQTVIIGSGPLAQRIAKDISNTKKTGYSVIGVVDTAKGAEKRMNPHKVYSTLKDLVRARGRKNIDEILQADSALEQEEVLEAVEFATTNHLSYRFVPNLFGLFATNSTVMTMSGVPVIEMKRTPLDGWGRIAKRAFDLVGSLGALLVFSPIMLIAGIGIKLSDPGPILYRQKRVTRTGKTFRIYKFRTMYMRYCTVPGGKSDEEIFAAELKRPDLAKEFQANNRKLANDPRVHFIGRWLRRTSLDELPQLFNVILGDLSMVGPRPFLEIELEQIGQDQATVFALKPGITGLWQISGRSDLGIEDRVKLDVYYVENWSLLMDLRVLLKTVPVVLFRRGAY